MVERYDLVFSPHLGGGIGPRPNGTYVRHSDYADLERELEQARIKKQHWTVRAEAAEQREAVQREAAKAVMAEATTMTMTMRRRKIFNALDAALRRPE